MVLFVLLLSDFHRERKAKIWSNFFSPVASLLFRGNGAMHDPAECCLLYTPCASLSLPLKSLPPPDRLKRLTEKERMQHIQQ